LSEARLILLPTSGLSLEMCNSEVPLTVIFIYLAD